MNTNVKKILLDIARKLDIKSSKVESKSAPDTQKGLIGKITMMNIIEDVVNHENHDTKANKLSVVIKQSPNDPKIHESFPFARIFQVEVLFYSKIAPTLRDFQLDYGANCLNCAECYYTRDTPMEEILVLENLSVKGYTVLNHGIPIQYAHMKMAFEELAKFHALGYALKELKPEVYKELVEQLHYNTLYELYKFAGLGAVMEKFTTRLKERFIGTKYNDIFSAFSDRILDIFTESNTVDEYAILCHGDAWCNNIMYTHNTDGQPTSAIFIDYQLSRIQSPVTDLAYLFYGCVDIDLLPRLNNLIICYYSTLGENLKVFGLDVKEIYPWSKLLDHWKIYGRQGLISAFILRVLMLTAPEENKGLSESVEKNVPIMVELFYYKMKREEEYNQTIEAIFKHFVDETFIS